MTRTREDGKEEVFYSHWVRPYSAAPVGFFTTVKLD